MRVRLDAFAVHLDLWLFEAADIDAPIEPVSPARAEPTASEIDSPQLCTGFDVTARRD